MLSVLIVLGKLILRVSWLVGGEVLKDCPEVLHVVSDVVQLVHRDLLAISQRLREVLLDRIRRVGQGSRMDMGLIFATAKVLDHIDGCNNLRKLRNLFPLFSATL